MSRKEINISSKKFKSEWELMPGPFNIVAPYALEKKYQLLSHSLYLPDMAPSDLIPKFKVFLDGWMDVLFK